MRVHQPRELNEALGILHALGDQAMVIAGGTDLLVDWHHRLGAQDQTFVDVSRLTSLRAVTWTDTAVTLGALTTYWDTIVDARIGREFPLLVAAASQVGAVQIQTRGTWAGNVMNASPAADGVTALMAYDATVILESAQGSEEIPLHEFYLGYKQLRRRPDQLLRAIRVPRRPHDFERFEKVGSRRAQAITKVGLAVAHSAAGWRIVASSVAPTVRRCPRLEAHFSHSPAFASVADVLAVLRHDVAPIDDLRSTSHYREQTLARILFFMAREIQADSGARLT
ncbi:MAG: xanthine dehydrogenase family protein subunit M [Planctomycetota bacterium]